MDSYIGYTQEKWGSHSASIHNPKCHIYDLGGVEDTVGS